MYRYISSESTFRAASGELYALDIASPVLYETSDEAEENEMCFRFEKHGPDVLLVIYPKEWGIVEDYRGIGKVLRPVPVGEPLARYTADEFFDAPFCCLKKYVKPEDRKDMMFPREFEEIYTDFNDLFPDLEEGEGIYITKSFLFNVVLV